MYKILILYHGFSARSPSSIRGFFKSPLNSGGIGAKIPLTKSEFSIQIPDWKVVISVQISLWVIDTCLKPRAKRSGPISRQAPWGTAEWVRTVSAQAMCPSRAKWYAPISHQASWRRAEWVRKLCAPHKRSKVTKQPRRHCFESTSEAKSRVIAKVVNVEAVCNPEAKPGIPITHEATWRREKWVRKPCALNNDTPPLTTSERSEWYYGTKACIRGFWFKFKKKIH